MPNPSEFVLTFLQSVGRRQDAEYYLRLFREQPKASFAVIVAEPDVFEQAPGAVIEPLRFLSELELFPILAPTALGPLQSVTVRELCEWIGNEGLQVQRFSFADNATVPGITAAIDRDEGVVVELDARDVAGRFSQLGALMSRLHTRKLVVLRSAGGLGPKEPGQVSLTTTHQLDTHESGIDIINLRADFDSLMDGNVLDPNERELLFHIKTLHELAPQLQTSVASPLNLLRELFTVKGAGTLIKTGSSIVRVGSYADLQLPRLVQLLQTTFGKRLHPDFLSRPILDVYFESAYRGAAIVQHGRKGSYLTKFAVEKPAQGEGIGRDLWEAMLRDHPVVYWRARRQNPISAWYQSECDGMHTVDDWRVFWRGLAPPDLDDAIADAMQRPLDFQELEA